MAARIGHTAPPYQLDNFFLIAQMDSFEANEIFSSLFKKNRNYNEIIETAKTLIRHPKESLKSKGLDLFALLVENNQAFNEALEGVGTCVPNIENAINLASLKVLQALARQGIISLASKEIAIALLESQESVSDEAVKLLELLIAKGVYLQEVFESVLRLVHSGEEPSQARGLILFTALVKKGQVYQEATETASVQYQSNDSILIKIRAQELFKALIAQGQALKEAHEIASLLVRSDNQDLQHRGRDLYLNLIEQGHGSKKIIEDATFFAQRQKMKEKKLSLHLFKSLVEAGYGYLEAADAASFFLKASDESLQQASLELLGCLVEKEQSYQFATQAVEFFLHSEEQLLNAEAFDLLLILIGKDQLFELARREALLLKTKDDTVSLCRALKICLALVNRDQAFQEATQIACGFIYKSQHRPVLMYTLDVFRALVAKDQDLALAQNAAEFLLRSRDVMVSHAANRLKNALERKNQGSFKSRFE
jgi:hypothetical protein